MARSPCRVLSRIPGILHSHRLRPFRLKFFASLHFSNFRFEAKQSEAKFKYIFSLFLLFSFFFYLFFAFFRFFCFFRFKFFASLQFSNLCFEAKQSEAKFKSIFSLFQLFFTFFRFFFAFFRFFRLVFVSLRFFRLIFAYFTFVFASDFWCFASK